MEQIFIIYSLSNEILNGLTLDLNIIFQIKLFK